MPEAPINLSFRKASVEDLESVVQLLANDPLGAQRESLDVPLPTSYIQAFKSITDDPNQELMVVCDSSQIIGTFQLSFIPYLTYKGGVRCQIEAVRVKLTYRSKGIGQKILDYSIDRARERGAHVLQLTTDKQRPNAIRFYKTNGFTDSHEGMKLHL